MAYLNHIPRINALRATCLSHGKPARKQGGVSLIEVLIALLIFAFGMLGVAGLQLASMKSIQYSSQSVIATNLAREYGEIMQSFPASVVSTSGTNTVAFFIEYADTPQAASVAKSCTGSSKDCTGADMATALRADWMWRVTSVLPQGRVEVCRDAQPRDTSDKRLKEWDNCDASGSLTVIKLGWTVKGNNAGSGLNQTWMTDSGRPQFAMALLGNLSDYKAP
jgi:type IV pilus assembly protein PilV